MPKITVTLQRLLPESTGCGDFKTMLVSPVTAVSAVSGKQNIQHVGHFLRNMVRQPPGPFLGAAKHNVSLSSLLLILAVQNRLAQVTGTSSPHHLRSHLTL